MSKSWKKQRIWIEKSREKRSGWSRGKSKEADR